jgi:hypothetical protein
MNSNYARELTLQQITIHARCVETYQPNLFPADHANVPPDALSTHNNPLVGRRILMCGRTHYKGYASYVRSLADGIANVFLDANKRTKALPFRDILDL